LRHGPPLPSTCCSFSDLEIAERALEPAAVRAAQERASEISIEVSLSPQRGDGRSFRIIDELIEGHRLAAVRRRRVAVGAGRSSGS